MEREVRSSVAVVVVALLAAAAGAPPALAASGWAPVAAPLTQRYGGMTTVLADGRVLTTGGINDRQGIARSAEIYDPASGRWSVEESDDANGRAPERSRIHGTLTTLRDGRVLLVGGFSSWDVDPIERTVEVFDPATGRWTYAAPLARARQGHVAALLPDGRLLVAGGVDTRGAPVAEAEIFDPATGTWSSGGTMAQAGYGSQSVVLADGRVLVAGGSTTAAGPRDPLDRADISRTEIFDPATTTWSSAFSLGRPRAQAGAALLGSGGVLVAGGVGDTGTLGTAMRFDPAPETSFWTTRLDPPVTGALASLTALRDDRVLMIAEGQRTTPLYDEGLDSWSSSYAMASRRSQSQHAQLQDGRVLAFGGTETTTAERFTQPTTRAADDADLGETAVGRTAERDVVVRNTGTEPLFTIGVSTTGAGASAFTVVADGCSRTPVPVGGSCVVRVRFAPSGVGPREATLAFDDNAESSPSSALRAVGTARVVDPTPTDPTPTAPTGPADPGPAAPTGSAPPVGGGPAPVAPRPVPVPCSVRSVVLFGVAPSATTSRPRVRLSGVASGLPAGTVVRIRRDGAQIGSTAVRDDGTVSATVAAPGTRRARLAARYRLVPSVGRRSAALKATRLATIGAAGPVSGGDVRVNGRVAGVRRATRLRIERTSACGPATVVVGTATTDARGGFRTLLAAPAVGEGAWIYRIRQGRRTVTLPIVVGARR
ncbi:kelch repeat-containing protein [Patulibacter minatonensis]|uniref:kelch repeat-containing protein n=1 Tax=Patulibacter minatonensis TaxID=298163 RepID=UPI00047EDFE3|nr:kelch repeat-containing protein [Patulibacter minatonensis]